MACYHPLKAFSLNSGGISFREVGDIRGDIKVPCGRCIGCRLDKARDWTLRILHESKLQPNNHFLTLSYDDDHLPNPPSLNYEHYQAFMKRARRYFGPWRFFMCAEYGDKTRRPHYHAIAFGLKLDDLKRYGGNDKYPLFTSARLNQAWGHGQVWIGTVTTQSANYVARYNLKKITGDLAEAHYRWVDPVTGEVHQLEPEFCQMSTRPGIGASWYHRFHTDFHIHDFAISDGDKTTIPKYYDRLAKQHGYQVDELKQQREIASRHRAEHNTPERLKVRETVAKARSNLSKRPL